MVPSYIKTFDVDTSGLSSNEQEMLKKLTAAAELVAPLYEKQKNSAYPGANFYPPDATREEIEEAAKKNPAILSPYTFVDRGARGKLVAVPYRKKFKKELTEIAKLLREAAALSKDRAFKAYLVARADDLLRDNFDKSNILWLKTAGSKIGFVLGPFDRYQDGLFSKKRVYTVWVSVLDKKQTREMESLRLAILAAERKHLPGARSAKIANMKIRIVDTPIFAGAEADSLFVAHNLPASADIALIKKHGTISPIFKQIIELRFSRWIFPIYKNLFEPNIKNKYGEEGIRRAFLLLTVFDEICHSKMRYDDATERLKEFYPYFDEVYADILSVKTSALLYLKGVLREGELHALILGEICQGLYYVSSRKERPHLEGFAMGYTLFLQSLLENKALQKTEKGFSVDFQKAFIATDELSHVFEYYLSLATRNDAKDFVGRFDPEQLLVSFQPFLPKT